MHRGYIGAGTIRTANHQSTPKGHRTFTHPVTPKASKIESDAPTSQ